MSMTEMKTFPKENLNNFIKWYSLAVLAICIFAYSYFPVANNSSNHVLEPPKFINNITIQLNDVYKPQIDRLILIIIDALRHDFINDEFMPFLSSQLRKDGCLLNVKVESPTVTLPRIKALTTGNVPQFSDILFNFDNSKLQGDSLLHRVKDAGKNIVFFGDETWLKLYPEMFLRSEGTTSFYVTDYTEVDDNVTRNIHNELKNNDWNMLILHYLGLDHIGHVYGPYHHLIRSKLKEMDGIVETIINNIENEKEEDERTIIVITGDHGMRNSGGHGGSSFEEITVPLGALGLQCQEAESPPHKPISQVDIAPTFSALFAVSLPADNIGIIRSKLLNTNIKSILYYFYYNALNLIEKNVKLQKNFQHLFHKHSEVLSQQNPDDETLKNLLISYEEHLEKASEFLVKKSISNHFTLLICSLNMLLITCVSLLNNKYKTRNFLLYSLNIILVVLNLVYNSPNLLFHFTLGVCLLILVIFLIYNLEVFSKFSKLDNKYSFIVFGGTIMQIISLASSSFIEEEHLIWFHLWNTLIVYNIYKKLQRKYYTDTFLSVFLVVLVRILRDLNHVGSNNSNYINLSDWLLQEGHSFWMNLLYITGLFAVLYFCINFSNQDVLIGSLSLFSILTLSYHRMYLSSTKTVIPITFTRILIFLIFFIGIVKRQNVYKTSTICWLLWISLLMRQQNIILVATYIVAAQILKKLFNRTTCFIEQLWLSMIFYYCQGTFNNLASIDISVGYIGLEEYSPFWAAFQILCHTYAFPTLSICLHLSNTKNFQQILYWKTIILHRLFSMTFTSAICIIHINHLFVWSVFSPKLIIEIIHSIYIFILLLIYKIFTYFTCYSPNKLKISV